MQGINKVLILGHLGQKPEIKLTGNGNPYAELRVATNRRIRSGDEYIDRVDWHNIRFWGRKAELCEEFLEIGWPVAIEGRLQTDTWTTSDGEKKSKSIVHGERLHLLPRHRAALDKAESAA